MGFFSRRRKSAASAPLRVPAHIAIIMDGNGRWAKKRGLPRTAGHAAGAETFRRIATYCKNIGVQYLTVYAFSTENNKRPAEEVSAIMGILEKYMREACDTMVRDRVRMKFFGDTSALSDEIRRLIARAEELSRTFEGVQVNMCVNYGARDEILRAARKLISGGVSPDDVTEARISDALYSTGIPDPDLIIRPGGEQRLSNFLLWQAAYAELYFTDILWPDFSESDLDDAIAEYYMRDRRFGEVKA